MAKALEKLAEIKAFANVEPKTWQQAVRQDSPLPPNQLGVRDPTKSPETLQRRATCWLAQNRCKAGITSLPCQYMMVKHRPWKTLISL